MASTGVHLGAWRAALAACALLGGAAACLGAQAESSSAPDARPSADDASSNPGDAAIDDAVTPATAMRLEARCHALFPRSEMRARVDAKGDIYVAGSVITSIVQGASHFDVRVAKLDSSCKEVWSKDYGPGFLLDLELDAQGNVVVLAEAISSYGGGLDFGQGLLKGQTIVAKIAPGGSTIFSRTLYEPPPDKQGYLRGKAIAALDDGSVVVGGTLRNAVSWGSTPVNGKDSEWLFVGSVGPTGDSGWVRTYSGFKGYGGGGAINGVTGDGNDVVVTGASPTSLDGLVSASYPESGFVTRLDGKTGDTQWQRSFARAQGGSVESDGQGALFASGRIYGDTDFGDVPHSVGPVPSSFLLDVDPADGETRWSRILRANVTRVAKLDVDRIVLIADAPLPHDGELGNGIRPGSAMLGIHERKGGTALWSAGWGRTLHSDVLFRSVDVAATNKDVIVAGRYWSEVDFGLGLLTNPDGPSITMGFVTRFAFVDGKPQASTVVPDAGLDASGDAGPLRTWSSVALGGSGLGLMCGLSGQNMYCAGSNAFGAFGNGAFDNALHPVPEFAGNFLAFKSIALGSGACGIYAGGELLCWGPDSHGQIGTSNASCFGNPCQTVPTVLFSGTNFRAVSTGDKQTCAITTTDALYCWGSNDRGALGYGPGGTGPTVLGGPYDAVSVGDDFVCALDKAGAAWCWGGTNSAGELGEADAGLLEVNRSPVAIPGNVTFERIRAGRRSACGIATSATTYCWGENVLGNVGDGTTTNRSVPTPVLTPVGVSFIDIQIGVAANGVDPGHTCGITSGGAMYCWGSNGLGQLGIGSPDQGSHPTPTLVPSLPSVAKIAVNGDSVCALTVLGERYCWGYNTSSGQLGKGDNQNAFSPVRVP